MFSLSLLSAFVQQHDTDVSTPFWIKERKLGGVSASRDY